MRKREINVSEKKDCHLFLSLPSLWRSEINLAKEEHENLSGDNISLNKFIKTILLNMSEENINPFPNFDFDKQVRPFFKKNDKWTSISFKKKERLIINNALNNLEVITKKPIQLNHYFLACIWEAMPFLDDLVDK